MSGRTPRASRLQRAAINASLLTVSLALAAGTAEVGVRVAAPQQLIMLRPDLWQPADTLGWVRRANVNAAINTGERTVRLLTDRDGFRIGVGGRTTGTPVLLLGDSFMEALQVEHEQSTAGLLETALSGHTGAPVAVRNAGVGGWGPGQYLSRARGILPQEEFRLVITAVYVGNDATPERRDYVPPRAAAERHRFRLPQGLSRTELVSSTLYPLNDALEVRSHLFILMRRNLETLRMRTGMTPEYFPPEFLKSEADAPRWGLAADVCREIAELAATHGAKALFVLVPADFQVDAGNFDQYVRGFGIDPATVDLDQPSRRLSEALGQRGLNVIDLLPEFRARHQSGERLYGTVDKHLSALGHQALVERVAPVAAELMRNP